MRVLWIALLLVACATPEERARKIVAEYGASCTALGFTPSTESHRLCMLRMWETDQPRASVRLN